MSQRICGLKYFNVFGPNEDHKGDMRSVVHKAYEQIREAGSVRLFKSYRPEYRDGEQRRDFIYVKDAVAMTLHLAESDAAGLFNVGTGSAQTWLELVRPIFHALELPERIEFVEMPNELRGKYQYYTCARVERLRATGYDRPIRRSPTPSPIMLRTIWFHSGRSRSPMPRSPHRSRLRRRRDTMPQPSRAERRRQGRGGAAPPPRRDPMRPIYIGVGVAFVAIILAFAGL